MTAVIKLSSQVNRLPESVLEMIVEYIGEIRVPSLHNLKFWLLQSPVPAMIEFHGTDINDLKQWATLLRQLHLQSRRLRYLKFSLPRRYNRELSSDTHNALLKALTLPSGEDPLMNLVHLDLGFCTGGYVAKYGRLYSLSTSLLIQFDFQCHNCFALDLGSLFELLSEAKKLDKLQLRAARYRKRRVSCDNCYAAAELKCSWICKLHLVKTLKFLDLQLVLTENDMQALVRALAESPNITGLTVQCANMASIRSLASHLKRDASLELLNIFGHFLEVPIRDDSDDTLTSVLNVLMDGLSQNTCLKSFRLTGRYPNPAADTAMVAHMIKTNKALTCLDFDNIRFNEDGARKIAQALPMNSTMRKIKIQGRVTWSPLRSKDYLRNAIKKYQINTQVVIEEVKLEKFTMNFFHRPYFEMSTQCYPSNSLEESTRPRKLHSKRSGITRIS